MAQKFRLGMKGKLFQGPGGTTGVPTTELSNVKDVTLTLDAAEADVTSRANSGFRATVSGLKECTIEFAMIYKPSDAGFKVIRNAWYTGDPIHLAALTSEKGEGPVGDFSVTGFSRSEPLEEAITYDVTCKLTEWEKWQEEVVEPEQQNAPINSMSATAPTKESSK